MPPLPSLAQWLYLRGLKAQHAPHAALHAALAAWQGVVDPQVAASVLATWPPDRPGTEAQDSHPEPPEDGKPAGDSADGYNVQGPGGSADEGMRTSSGHEGSSEGAEGPGPLAGAGKHRQAAEQQVQEVPGAPRVSGGTASTQGPHHREGGEVEGASAAAMRDPRLALRGIGMGLPGQGGRAQRHTAAAAGAGPQQGQQAVGDAPGAPLVHHLQQVQVKEEAVDAEVLEPPGEQTIAAEAPVAGVIQLHRPCKLESAGPAGGAGMVPDGLVMTGSTAASQAGISHAHSGLPLEAVGKSRSPSVSGMVGAGAGAGALLQRRSAPLPSFQQHSVTCVGTELVRSEASGEAAAHLGLQVSSRAVAVPGQGPASWLHGAGAQAAVCTPAQTVSLPPFMVMQQEQPMLQQQVVSDQFVQQLVYQHQAQQQPPLMAGPALQEQQTEPAHILQPFMYQQEQQQTQQPLMFGSVLLQEQQHHHVVPTSTLRELWAPPLPPAPPTQQQQQQHLPQQQILQHHGMQDGVALPLGPSGPQILQLTIQGAECGNPSLLLGQVQASASVAMQAQCPPLATSPPLFQVQQLVPLPLELSNRLLQDSFPALQQGVPPVLQPGCLEETQVPATWQQQPSQGMGWNLPWGGSVHVVMQQQHQESFHATHEQLLACMLH